jgi:hypothetical protein
VDYALGQFFELLKTKGLYDSSLIIIVSDHGESLGEHNLYQHDNVYETTARVASLVKFPNNQYAGMEINDLTILEDILPTILDVLCIDAKIKFDGVSLKKFINQKSYEDREVFSKNINKTQMSLIGNKYKFIKDIRNQSEELYNLIDDPNEERVMPLSKGIIAEQLKDKLKKQNSAQESGWIILVKGLRVFNKIEVKYYPRNNINKIHIDNFLNFIESDLLTNYGYINLYTYSPKIEGKLSFYVKNFHEKLTLDITSSEEFLYFAQRYIKERKKNCIYLSPDAPMVFDKELIFPMVRLPLLAIQKIEAQKTNQDKIELPTEAIENLKALGI